MAKRKKIKTVQESQEKKIKELWEKGNYSGWEKFKSERMKKHR